MEIVCCFEDEIRRLTAFPKLRRKDRRRVPGEITEVEALEPAAGDSGNHCAEAALKIFGGTVQKVRYESEGLMHREKHEKNDERSQDAG